MIVRFMLIFSLFLSSTVLAQNLMVERIWKVASRKKSIFLDAGVFHNNSAVKNSSIVSVRNSVVPNRGYERVVIDFNTPTIPRVYGHISAQKQNISVDLFDTKASANQTQLKDSKHVKSIDFISVDGKTMTMEMKMKGKASFDIFYLENPGRLVIDIR